jgi:hypothetical protein
MFVASRAFIDGSPTAIACRIHRFAAFVTELLMPCGALPMEGLMDACLVRTTATWLAAIFVSSLFVTAATSVAGIL